MEDKGGWGGKELVGIVENVGRKSGEDRGNSESNVHLILYPSPWCIVIWETRNSLF